MKIVLGGDRPMQTKTDGEQSRAESRWLCLGLCRFEDAGLLGADLLVQLSDLEADDGLEEARPVVAAGEVGVLQHLLRDLAVELGRDVAQVALHVDELLELVKLAIHLHDRHLQRKELDDSSKQTDRQTN